MWPEVMLTLLELASRSEPRAAARGLSALYRVVKQQASRSAAAAPQAVLALAAELEPRLRPLHATHARACCRPRATGLCRRGCGLAGTDAPANAVTEGGWILRAAVGLCKLERQLLLHGWPHLHVQPEACALLASFVDMLEEVHAAQRRLMGNASGEDGERGVPSSGVTASGVSLGGAGDGVSACPAAAALMPLLLVPSKLLHEVQDLQPLATKDFLARGDRLLLAPAQLATLHRRCRVARREVSCA